MKKVLVTGGAGFVGTHLVEKLLKKGYIVTVLDNFSSGYRNNLHSEAKLIEADIRNFDIINDNLNKTDVIFHLAAIVDVQRSVRKPNECFEINTVGTANILQAAINNSVRKIIFASSCAVYPLSPHKKVSEEMSVNGSSPYSISKLSSEDMLNFYADNFGIETCSLRCFNIYGPKQSTDSMYSAVIPTFIKYAKNGDELKLYNSGNQTRDFIHVSDVVNFYCIAAEENIAGIYNLGTGKETKIKDLANKILSFENRSSTKNLPAKPGDALSSCADMTKASKDTGFQSKISLEEGLKNLYFG